VDHFPARLVVPRGVPHPVPQTPVKPLTRLPDRPLTTCATDAGWFA